jgi:hypothetical protein
MSGIESTSKLIRNPPALRALLKFWFNELVLFGKSATSS